MERRGEGREEKGEKKGTLVLLLTCFSPHFFSGVCGDSLCNSNIGENCTSCVLDCGHCGMCRERRERRERRQRSVGSKESSLIVFQ